MELPKDGVDVKADAAFWYRPLSLDFGGFFTSLGKATTFTVMGTYDEAMASAIEALAAVGITRTTEQLAGALLSRSMGHAVSQLLRHHVRDFSEGLPTDIGSLSGKIEEEIRKTETRLDADFLAFPYKIEFVKAFQERLESWLTYRKIGNLNAKTVVARLPDFFVWGLHVELQEQKIDYGPLIGAINTPIAEAWRKTRTWDAYRREFKKQLAEPIFGEAFSLPQIFIWPRAQFREVANTSTDNRTIPVDETFLRGKSSERQFIVDLKDALDHWIEGANASDTQQRHDAIRIISGDPGSGKSSFTKMYADYRMDQGDHVLFVPLHRLNVQGELGTEIELFCTETDNCPTGLLSAETAEDQLLIVLDGLDELSKQGAIGATIASAFVDEVIRKVANRNSQSLRVRVIISGRPIAIQNVTDKFRDPKQVISVLPYFHAGKVDTGKYCGRWQLLNDDLRHVWWNSYGELTGLGYDTLPDDLNKPELIDITSQPLLNFLLALVYQHEMASPASERKIDFKGTINRNEIYEVLLERVYERDWDPAKSHKSLGKLNSRDFQSLLEEMALTAWHGSERTTTVSAVRKQCAGTYLEKVLQEYEQHCDDGVGSLFTAFYFRKSEKTEGPEPTFEFTHKSFGEYLTALRIVDCLEEIDRQLNKETRRLVNAFSIDAAILEWLKVFGPTTISEDLIVYVRNEIPRRKGDGCDLRSWQQTLVKLMNQSLVSGMPCERLENAGTFIEMRQLSNNAEAALFVLHSLIADVTNHVSKINWPNPTSADSLLGAHHNFILRDFLNHINFDKQRISCAMLVRVNFRNASFFKASLIGCNFWAADFSDADLRHSNLSGTSFAGAQFKNANLKSVSMGSAVVQYSFVAVIARLNGTNFSGATVDFSEIDFEGVPSLLPDGSEPLGEWENEIKEQRRLKKLKRDEARE